jgi:hypothetical protein
VPYPQPKSGSNRPSLSAQGMTVGHVGGAALNTSQPVSALGRAPSLSSGKVTFAPAPVPAPRRAVSSAMGIEIQEEAKRRRETRDASHQLGGQRAKQDKAQLHSQPPAPGPVTAKSAPIKCPKVIQKEDLGWTEGALLNIRKHVGKGE